MIRPLAVLLLLPLAAAAQTANPAQPSPPDTWLPRTTADLIVLDKLSAQPSTLSVKTGQQATVGPLTIALKSCVTRPPDLPQDSAAFLDITDSRSPTPAQPIFHGWILSNTPAVNQLQHPVYDIRLAACR